MDITENKPDATIVAPTEEVATEKIEQPTESPTIETEKAEEPVAIAEKAEVNTAEAAEAKDAIAEETTTEEDAEEKLFSEGGINVSLLKQKTWRMWETVTERIGQCPGSPGN